MIAKLARSIAYLAIIAGILIGLPYLYNLSTTPWAGTGDGKITATWVGPIVIQRTSDSAPESAAEDVQPAGMPGALLMSIRLSLLPGANALAVGKIVECERGGLGFSTKFPESFVNLDSSAPGASLTASPETMPSEHIPSFFDTHWDGHNALKVQFLGLRNVTVQGTLHKGREVDFTHLCQAIH